jgi:hypothetical protein
VSTINHPFAGFSSRKKTDERYRVECRNTGAVAVMTREGVSSRCMTHLASTMDLRFDARSTPCSWQTSSPSRARRAHSSNWSGRGPSRARWASSPWAGLGLVCGVLAARSIPVTLIAPATGKGAIGLPGSKDAAKDASRSEAVRRWPNKGALFSRVKDHGRSDAALAGIKREAAP